jgi:hypothetical protein
MTFNNGCKVLIVLVAGMLGACNQPPQKINYANGSLVSRWEQNLTEAIMVDMFSPPVASRIYAYANLAAYESLRHTDSSLRSFAGRLNGLHPLPEPQRGEAYDFRVVGLTAFSEVAASLVYTKNIIHTFQKQSVAAFQEEGIDEPVLLRSEAFGKQIAAEILKWAATDSFRQTRGMIRYTLLEETGSWEPTPPDYMQGAEPHWNKIRLFVIDSAACFRPDTLPVAFSIDPDSEFYRNAKELVTASKTLDSNQYAMAAFWDDNPGVSSVYGHMKHIKKKMTPGGHWMAITGHVAEKEKLSMAKTAELFAATSIAIIDAFISCWDAKYHYQTIRPVTYIHRHITVEWQPLLQTPPFPEFPSGHATISAAAATVLTALAGDNYAFTDSSEYRYGLPVRSFGSFMEAARESARSRFYGGIHFMPSNESGTQMGIKVGEKVVEKFVSGKGV